MFSSKKPETSPNPAYGLIQIHLAVLLFGLSGLFGKFLSCSPVYIVLGRCVFAAISLMGFFIWIQKDWKPLRMDKVMLGMLAAQGLLLAIHWLCFFHAIQLSGVGLGLVTFSTFPLFVTILEPFVFHEPLQKKDIATSLTVFAGIILVVPDMDLSNQITAGAFWGILSGATFAILSIVNRKTILSCSSVAIAFYQDSFAGLFLLVPALLMPLELPAFTDIFSLIFLGTVCTALAHTLFIQSLSSIRAQTASIITCLEPLYGTILAFLLLHEIPAWQTLAGGILIIGASIYTGWTAES